MRVRCGGVTRTLRRGDVYFVGAGAGLQLEAQADSVAWMAACNGMGFEPLGLDDLPAGVPHNG